MSEEDVPGLIARIADRLDLGAYERAAYVAVLEHGSLSASELAERTDIPQPRVYDTVRRLEDRGLVEVHESRPMRIVAIDPGDAFGEIATGIETLQEHLEAIYTAPDPEEIGVSLVTSAATIDRNVERVIEEAEYELSLALDTAALVEYEDQLRAARDRDVSIELIVSPASEVPASDEFDYTQIANAVRARRGRTTPMIAVADGAHAIYATDANRGRYGVILNRSALGFLLFGFYGTVLWSTSAPVIEEDDAAELPRRYATVRRCIREIGEIDRTLYASVDGRWVVSDESCSLDGRIVGTTLEETRHVAHLELETEDGKVTVGGRLAAYEDIEAHVIRVDTEIPRG